GFARCSRRYLTPQHGNVQVGVHAGDESFRPRLGWRADADGELIVLQFVDTVFQYSAGADQIDVRRLLRVRDAVFGLGRVVLGVEFVNAHRPLEFPPAAGEIEGDLRAA